MDADVAKNMNIYQRLNAIKTKVDYVQKNQKKIDGQYTAVTHDAVTALTRQHFVDAGVMIVPHEMSSEVKDTGTTTGKGTPFIRFESKYRIDFINIDQPEQVASVEFTAHALDHGDKAPGKAHSYAVKYAILKILQLETGDDDESRDEQKPKKDKPTHSPTDGAYESLSPADKIKAQKITNSVIDCWADEKPVAAYEQVYEANLESEIILAIWELLRSHTEIRSELKKMRKAANETAQGK